MHFSLVPYEYNQVYLAPLTVHFWSTLLEFSMAFELP